MLVFLKFLMFMALIVAANVTFGRSIMPKMKNFNPIGRTSDLYNPDYKILIKSCETYPYYHPEKQQGGSEKLKEDLLRVDHKISQCLDQHDFTREVRNRFQSVIEVITGAESKILECRYGKSNSFFARATTGFDSSSDDIRYQMPPHPAVIFDTNRMAGNFPLTMNGDEIAIFRNFWGNGLDEVEIAPGLRNPFYTKIVQTDALAWHEMAHWGGYHHHPNDELDFVYLSQLCCFPDSRPGKKVLSARACELLNDQELWQEDVVERKRAINERNLIQELEQMIRSHY